MQFRIPSLPCQGLMHELDDRRNDHAVPSPRVHTRGIAFLMLYLILNSHAAALRNGHARVAPYLPGFLTCQNSDSFGLSGGATVQASADYTSDGKHQAHPEGLVKFLELAHLTRLRNLIFRA